jgi:hypothetical protein
MGQARNRLATEGQKIAFDFDGPDMLVMKRDREFFLAENDGNEALVVPQATKVVIAAISNAAFPQGMDRKEGKVWAAWLDAIDHGDTVVDITRGMLDWLLKHAEKEDLKLPGGQVQWREALVDYLQTLAREVSEVASLERPGADPSKRVGAEAHLGRGQL